MPSRCGNFFAIVALATWLVSSVAAAQEPIVNNDFTIDVFTGPVLGALRIVGLGGAYTALAQAIDGLPWNPASSASRIPWELDWFEWDVTASLLLPAAFANNDFDNDGKSGFTYSNFYFLDFGGRLQFGELGVGALWRIQSYRVETDLGDPVDVRLTTSNVSVGHSFGSGQLVLGAGLRAASLELAVANSGPTLGTMSGVGAEIGTVLRMHGLPWRLGFAARTSVTSDTTGGEGVSTDANGIRRAEPFILPDKVHLPWEIQAGFAYQFGPRPLNSAWENPHDVAQRLRAELRAKGQEPLYRQELRKLEHEREAVMLTQPRQYVLTSFDVILTGPTPNAVGLESFLSQTKQRSGRYITPGLRFGAETEPWLERLKVRVGSYLEPSRFDSSDFRLHATTGFDIKVLAWDLFGLIDREDFRITTSVDWAPRYFDWGIGIGVWH